MHVCIFVSVLARILGISIAFLCGDLFSSLYSDNIKTNSYLIFRGLNRRHVGGKPFREITCHGDKINS